MNIVSVLLYPAAGLCLLYALAIGAKYGFRLDHLYAWPLLAALLALAGLGAAARPALALLLLPPVLLCTLALLRLLPDMRARPAAEIHKDTLVIVLGIDPGFRLLDARADCAAALLRREPSLAALLSGGNGEAEALRARLLHNGIAPERIRLENRSRTTVENLHFCAGLAGNDLHPLIVTSNFHAMRTLSAARRAGFADAACLLAPTPALILPHCLLREILVMLFEALHGDFTLWRKP